MSEAFPLAVVGAIAAAMKKKGIQIPGFDEKSGKVTKKKQARHFTAAQHRKAARQEKAFKAMAKAGRKTT